MRGTVRKLVGAALTICASGGCSNALSPDAAAPAPTPPPEISAELRVYAGYDLFLALPESTLVLRAQSSNAVGNEDVRWTKIAGPSSYRLNTLNRYAVQVSGLEQGTYAFEIATREATGRLTSDTIAVHVVDENAVQTVDFPVNTWECPMGCSVSVGRLEPQIPKGAVLRVLWRPSGFAAFEEIRSVFDEKYVYGLVDGRLELYSQDDQSSGVVRVLWTMPPEGR
jgi:hypothetical protein